VAYYQQILSNVIQYDDEEKKGSTATGKGLAGIVGQGLLEQYNNFRDFFSMPQDPKEIFIKIIKTFEHVNFYNVLVA